VLADPAGNLFILSNNHVLADENRGSPGDPVLQPGPTDGGTAGKDVIARLTRFVPIDFAGANRADAAIAQAVRNPDLEQTLLKIGKPTGIAAGRLKDKVRKSGRTTGLTSGSVTRISVTARVGFDGGVATFTDLLETGAMSAGGDSGSVLVNAKGAIVGLLFAGSNSSTLYCDIAHVIRELDLAGFRFGGEIPTAGAVAFVDPGYRGTSLTVTADIRDTGALGFQDSISSIHVLSGSVLCYESAGYRGRALYVEDRVPDTAAVGFKDTISSVKVFGGPLTGITVYGQEAYRGRSAFLDSNTPDVRKLGLGETVSSIRVHGKATATLFEKVRYGGSSRRITRNARDTGSIGMKGIVSSIRLEE
jgi:hypothetical protein